jgi:hypothetical protein
MPGPQPPAVPLSEAERQALHTMIRAHKTPQHLSFRAHVILLLAEGLTAPDVARRLGTTRTTVRRWRRHWLKRPAIPCPSVSKTPPAPGLLPPSAPSSGARSSPWPVSPRRRQGGLSAIGRRANSQMRPVNVALSGPSPSAMWGVF